MSHCGWVLRKSMCVSCYITVLATALRRRLFVSAYNKNMHSAIADQLSVLGLSALIRFGKLGT